MSVRRGNCAVTGKVCFTSRAKAKEVIRNKHMVGVSTFLCESCSYFHVGGWHGTKDRLAHREMHGATGDTTAMPIDHAARFLGVSVDIVHRMIQAGKVRGTDTRVDSTDISRIKLQILRTP